MIKETEIKQFDPQRFKGLTAQEFEIYQALQLNFALQKANPFSYVPVFYKTLRGYAIRKNHYSVLKGMNMRDIKEICQRLVDKGLISRQTFIARERGKKARKTYFNFIFFPAAYFPH